MDLWDPEAGRRGSKPDCRRFISNLASATAPHLNEGKVKKFCENISRKFSDQEFYSQLGQHWPAPGNGSNEPPNSRPVDAEYERISELLLLRGKPTWALRPRHFFVLYMIGMENIMDDIVSENKTDFSFPYKKSNLPVALRGVDRDRFLRYQKNVLGGAALQIANGGPHQYFDRDRIDALFYRIAVKGRGAASTQVEHVVNKISIKHYALKRIYRSGLSRDDDTAMQLFTTELEILKSLPCHRHLVKLHASFSDPEQVALVIHPLADANLAEFLRCKLDEEGRMDRKIRLRSFFGCIALTIDYLHNNRKKNVRHKDIKPENILVKDDKVYIADFGTSHAWTGDASGMTEGTLPFFTRKYLPPGALDRSRGKSSDIWSLGCVFLEMCTVLAGFSIEDMIKFFCNHGSGEEYYFRNEQALHEWLDQLRTQFDASEAPQDSRIVDLVGMMCEHEESARLESDEVVRRIFEIQSPFPYHGLCCNRERWLRRSYGITPGPVCIENRGFDDDNLVTGDKIVPEPTQFEYAPYAEDHQSPTAEEQEITIQAIYSYQPPMVEEAEVTVQAPYNEPPSDARHILEDARHARHDSAVATPQVVPSDEAVESKLGEELDEIEQPAIKEELGTEQKNERPSHASQERPKDEDVNELNVERMSALLSPAVANGSACKTPKTLFEPPNLDPNALPCPWPGCRPPKGQAILLFDSIESVREHLREKHFVHEYAWTCLYDATEMKSPKRPKLSPQNGAWIIQPQSVPQVVRFCELPESRRPKLERILESRKLDSKIASYSIKAEPLDAATLTGAPMQDAQDAYGMPQTSFAPSYLLASKNRFTQAELLQKQTQKPLFVYGSFMFPTVLTSRSRAFCTSEGTYSSQQGRRLRTSASDWNNINSHIQSAAGAMTPALIQGYRRFRYSGSDLAYLEPMNQSASVNTIGFLVFGLSSEALACLEHLYEKDGPAHYFKTASNPKRTWAETQLKRQDVKVSINAAGGDIVDVEAITFVATKEALRQNLEKRQWRMDEFLSSQQFNRLTNSLEDGDLIKEEETIASRIGTTLMLRGDRLVAKILQKDVNGLGMLLEQGYCTDAPSAEYGTALQAAAAKGHQKMLQMLLNAGAKVDAKGGQYGCALIAAVVENKLSMVKILLDYGASPFTPGGRYISALYQAVNFNNIDIAHVLLEKGAWLTDNYNELLDLASERGDREMRRELETYNVRDLKGIRHARDTIRQSGKQTIQPADRRSDKGEEKNGRASADLSAVNTSFGVPMVFEAMRLQGQEGKWTGIKGVKLMRVALANGMPESIIPQIRPHLHSWPSIQRFLAKLSTGLMQNGPQPIRHTNLLAVDRDEDRVERKKREHAREA